jgi:TPP-dependent pyruvate/acetoin dehydrogenase alpha subunit
MEEEETLYRDGAAREIGLAPTDPIEQAIDELLDGDLRADEWRELREALTGRLREAVAERDALPESDPTRADWDLRVEELRDQVAALATEEAVTEFVEKAARVTFARPTAEDDDEFAIDL